MIGESKLSYCIINLLLIYDTKSYSRNAYSHYKLYAMETMEAADLSYPYDFHVMHQRKM